jgi:flagellar basal body-associated protein FliL
MMDKVLKSKKVLVIATICLLVLGIIAVIILALQRGGQQQWKYYPISADWDRLKVSFAERAAGKGADNYLVLSENISLTEAEFDNFVDFTEILGWGMTRATSFVDFLQMKALYHYCVTIGLEPTDEAVKEVLEQHKQAVRYTLNADLEGFLAFVEWTGLTENEYWKLHYDIAKLGAVHSKLEEYVRDNILVKDENFDEREEHQLFWEEFQQWMEDITAQVLADEGIDLAEIEESLR